MDKLSPAEAADRIRDDFRTEPLEPDYLHRARFAESVCDQMGVERSHGNTERVLKLLEKHGIDGSAYEAFPGWFENDLGERAVCQTEEDKDAFMSRSADENGVVGPDQGSIDAHGKFFIGRGYGRKSDIRATMPRHSDERDIQEVGETSNDSAPLHRMHDLGKEGPDHQPTNNLPDPASLMMNPPNPVDPTHDNRPGSGATPIREQSVTEREHRAPKPGDNPAPHVNHDGTDSRSEVEHDDDHADQDPSKFESV